MSIRRGGDYIHCLGCQVNFYRKFSLIRKYNFHSTDCYNKFLASGKPIPWVKKTKPKPLKKAVIKKKVREDVVCFECGITFAKYISIIRKRNFHSKKCYHKYLAKGDNIPWLGNNRNHNYANN